MVFGLSKTSHCERCTAFARVFFTGKQWLCRACWDLLFRDPPEGI